MYSNDIEAVIIEWICSRYNCKIVADDYNDWTHHLTLCGLHVKLVLMICHDDSIYCELSLTRDDYMIGLLPELMITQISDPDFLNAVDDWCDRFNAKLKTAATDLALEQRNDHINTIFIVGIVTCITLLLIIGVIVRL